MKHNTILFIPVILFLTLFFSCQDSGWYPSAEVAIENHFEYLSQTEIKSVAITFTIHNTSKTSIVASAITFKIITDQREYLQTVSSNVRIIPDGLIALSTAVPYLDNTENFVSVSIVNTFFE